MDNVQRIIGGRFRGRKLLYSGDRRTRPMKLRVREALFNLVGPAVRDRHVIDLFAGTGALALEALSRGAARATMLEQHFPTAAVIERNVEALGLADVATVHRGDAFIWARNPGDLGPFPWLVLCSPPYAFYADRTDQMLRLVGDLIAAAPTESLFVVEADEPFDFGLLPRAEDWDVRRYLPAVVGILAV